ncbi:MAG TPA: ssl1498 family light-harvesting-like protein [Coleofasciculaceae cyanobacterium]
MYTTSNEGLLNNYAVEPAVYLAEYPFPEEQRRYAFQAAIATLFVTLTILTALAIS